MPSRAEDIARAREMYENGVKKYEAGEYAQAVDLFSSALRLDQEDPRYYSYLGLALVRRPSRFNEAREYCEKAIEMEPFNHQFYLNLAEAYKSVGMHDKAIKVFKDVLRLDCENGSALMNLKQYAEEGSRTDMNGFEKLIRRFRW